MCRANTGAFGTGVPSVKPHKYSGFETGATPKTAVTIQNAIAWSSFTGVLDMCWHKQVAYET